MSSSNLMRLCGFAAFIGGVLLLISVLLDLDNTYGQGIEVAVTGIFVLTVLLSLLGSVLLLLGLFGLYTRQAEDSGALGLIGFLAAFLGTAMVAGASWTDTFVTPFLVGVIPQIPGALAPVGFTVGFATFVLGWLLFGVATLRAHIYPRTAAWLLLIGIIGTALGLAPPNPIPGFMFFLVGSNVLFCAAVAWLGFALFRRGNEAMHHDEAMHQPIARVGYFLYGVLLAIVGLSGKPDEDDERDDEKGKEPDTASGT